MKRIVIWGDDHHNALGLLRMLGGRGFDILFIVHGGTTSVATSSKYCTKYIVVHTFDEGLSFLIANYCDESNKAVLLFTADKYSEFANSNLGKLTPYFHVAGPMQNGLLRRIDDKYIMGKMAQECGIVIPQTALISQDNKDAINLIAHFPVIIKPCDPANKGFKTKIVKNSRELERVSKSFLQHKRYVVQQYIEKDADGLVYGCRTNDGRVILAGICIRNRWGDDECGSFGYLSPEIPSAINQEGIALFLERIDFRGLFSVEYALTKDEAYFYEFNLRNDGTSVLFYNAGANIALAYVNSCFGISDEIPTCVKGKQYLMHEILDRFNIYDGKVSKKQWLEDKKKVTIHFLYDPDDMKPYEIQKGKEMMLYVHHIISRTWINKIRLKFKNYILTKRATYN